MKLIPVSRLCFVALFTPQEAKNCRTERAIIPSELRTSLENILRSGILQRPVVEMALHFDILFLNALHGANKVKCLLCCIFLNKGLD